MVLILVVGLSQMSLLDFIKAMQLPWTNSYWKSIKYFQTSCTNSKQESNTIRVLVDIKRPESLHTSLFERASAECSRLYRSLLTYSNESPAPSLDQTILSELKGSPHLICEYFAYKVHHFIKSFHKINLLKYVCEFTENQFGVFELSDAKVYSLHTEKHNLYSQAPVARLAFLNNVMKRATYSINRDIVADHQSKLRRYVRLVQQNREAEKARAAGGEHVLTVREDFEDYSESDGEQAGLPNSEDDPQNLMNELKREYVEDEVQTAIFKKMKEGVVKRFQDMRTELKRNNVFQQRIEECELAFKEVLPEIQVKLQDIVMDEYMDFDWAQKKARDKKNLIPCLNPALNYVKRKNDLMSSKSKEFNQYQGLDTTAGLVSHDFHLDDIKEIFERGGNINTDYKDFKQLVDEKRKKREESKTSMYDTSEIDLNYYLSKSSKKANQFRGNGSMEKGKSRSRNENATKATSFSYARPYSNIRDSVTTVFPSIKQKINKLMSQVFTKEKGARESKFFLNF